MHKLSVTYSYIHIYVLWSWLFRVIIWCFALAAVFQDVPYYGIQTDSEPISLYCFNRIFVLCKRFNKVIPPKYMLPRWDFCCHAKRVLPERLLMAAAKKTQQAGRKLVLSEMWMMFLMKGLKDRMKVRIWEQLVNLDKSEIEVWREGKSEGIFRGVFICAWVIVIG